MSKKTELKKYIELFKEHYIEQEKTGFNLHFRIYVASLLFFLFLNVVTMKNNEWWIQYPAGFWALGLIIHYFSIKNIKEEINEFDKKLPTLLKNKKTEKE